VDVRPILLTLGVIAVAWLALVVYVWLTQRSLIYLPDSRAPDPALLPPGGEAVQIETDDGLALDGWFLPAAGRNPEPGPAVVVFNGNAGNRGDRVPLGLALSDSGLHVLLVDYRGYGGNPGSPSETGLLADARAAAALLATRPEVDLERIVYFGESLGGAVAVALAVERRPAALILRSPFSSLASMGRRHYPYLPMWDPLLWDRFESRGAVARLDAPLLVIVGSADGIVPPEESRAVYDAAPEPKSWVVIEGAHHNDPALLDGDEMRAAITDFLAGRRVIEER
jgi:fermentation-respiration switch protein FrsA (DUF1100 family)